MHLIDIGLNLTHDSFDRDRDAVWQRARDAGVTRAILTGASREHSPKALELARTRPGEWFATAGVHPHHAVEYTDETTSATSPRDRRNARRSSASCRSASTWPPPARPNRCSCTSAMPTPTSWRS